MKVNIYETVEVSDEQRKQIAALVDGPEAKARPATRDELKAFIWEHGSGWLGALVGTDHEDVAGTPDTEPETTDSDEGDEDDIL